MSGHSKWSTIKRAKSVNDAKRGQIFTKLARSITLAAKKSGPNPADNPFLRKAIEEAKAQNLPRENIDRAISKALGGGAGEILLEMTLEGYGPGGVAFLLTAVSDNRNRTLSEVRNVFSRYGGSLSQPGSTSHVFGGDPQNPIFLVRLEGDLAGKVLALAESLEDLEDVQEVFANFDVPESILTERTI